jgi:cytochrome bd ubiquinol oxidase subunit I
MALSLAFHIVFASIGMTMPLLMVLAEHRWRRTGEPEALALAKAWAKGTAVLFAVGAVSGTVLAFELGLLFPRFMELAGPVIGLPFALEGVAFFTEAVFLGLYLYGWDRLKPALHLAAGWIVAFSGFLSAAFVTLANAWMQTPVGFRTEGGRLVAPDPWVALFPPSASHEVPHGVLASYAAIATVVAAIHAGRLLKEPGSKFHWIALRLALFLAIPANLAQPFLGHRSGQEVARLQPLKLAAFEGHFDTGARVPLLLGGITDYETQTTRYALEIPGGLSFLATGSFGGTVAGLRDFDKSLWPPVLCRLAFQAMLACGTLLFLVYGYLLFQWLRRRALPLDPRLLKLLWWTGPLGVVALEAGWIAAEVGRQPWIIYGVMRTDQAISNRPQLWVSLILFAILYVILGTVVARILAAYVRKGAAIVDKTPGGE